VVLVAGVLIGLRLSGSTSSPTGSPGTTQAGQVLSSGRPGRTVESQTVHLAQWGLTLDYPAAWRLSRAGSEADIGYITILAFLGSGTGQEICTPVGVTVQCYSDIHLQDDQVMVRLSQLTQPVGGPFDPADAKWVGPGQELVTVGGLPATFTQSSRSGWYSSDLALVWDLSAPGSPLARYEIAAYIKGPDVASLRTEVERLVASVRFDPGPAKLDPAMGPVVAAGALAQLAAADPGGFCYPATVGASNTEIQSVFDVQLSKPLPVTCQATIQPYVGFWKLTVKMSWEAAPDRNPGSYTIVYFLTPDGARTWSESAGSPVPYWPTAT
jgi:hypothetical protein